VILRYGAFVSKEASDVNTKAPRELSKPGKPGEYRKAGKPKGRLLRRVVLTDRRETWTLFV
jgi:hypothetical protein